MSIQCAAPVGSRFLICKTNVPSSEVVHSAGHLYTLKFQKNINTIYTDVLPLCFMPRDHLLRYTIDESCALDMDHNRQKIIFY